MFLYLVVKVHYMKYIEKLSLVLMKSLYLNIEYGTRVNLNSVVLLNVLGKSDLVTVLNLHELTSAQLIISIYLELAHLRKVCNPVVANLLCYPVCKKRIAVKKESSLCNAIGLVVELFRHHLIEILKLLLLKNLCVKLCNTVYREARSDCKVSHLNLSVVHDCHLADFLLIARIHGLNLLDKASVNLLDNLVYSRKKS